MAAASPITAGEKSKSGVLVRKATNCSIYTKLFPHLMTSLMRNEQWLAQGGRRPAARLGPSISLSCWKVCLLQPPRFPPSAFTLHVCFSPYISPPLKRWGPWVTWKCTRESTIFCCVILSQGLYKEICELITTHHRKLLLAYLGGPESLHPRATPTNRFNQSFFNTAKKDL